jgi:hypothetical protein
VSIETGAPSAVPAGFREHLTIRGRDIRIAYFRFVKEDGEARDGYRDEDRILIATHEEDGSAISREAMTRTLWHEVEHISRDPYLDLESTKWAKKHDEDMATMSHLFWPDVLWDNGWVVSLFGREKS